MRRRRFPLLSIAALGLAAIVFNSRTPVDATALDEPKPNETGVPTPPPTMVIPMTPAPTLAVPDEKPPPRGPAPTPGQPQPDDPFSLIVSATRISDREIVLQDATVVAIGTMQQLGAAQWTTPNGQRPPNPHAPGASDSIYQPMDFAIEAYLKGDQATATLRLWLAGGSVGHDTVTVSGDDRYDFQNGQRYMVYLRPIQRTHAQGGNMPTLWQILDRYTITSDGQAVNSFGSQPLQQLLDEIVQRP